VLAILTARFLEVDIGVLRDEFPGETEEDAARLVEEMMEAAGEYVEHMVFESIP
jgi:hypothetical protein